jgi:hypothetical protein
MITCEKCGRDFKSLGFASHRRACGYSSNVDNGHRRHKCSICGRVRFEKYLSKIESYSGHTAITRYGNMCWACVDNPDCRQKSSIFSSY